MKSEDENEWEAEPTKENWVSIRWSDWSSEFFGKILCKWFKTRIQTNDSAP